MGKRRAGLELKRSGAVCGPVKCNVIFSHLSGDEIRLLDSRSGVRGWVQVEEQKSQEADGRTAEICLKLGDLGSCGRELWALCPSGSLGSPFLFSSPTIPSAQKAISMTVHPAHLDS